MEAGLVEGEEIYFDATRIEADASMDSLRPRLSLSAAQQHIRTMFEEDPAPGEESPPPVTPSDRGGARAGRETGDTAAPASSGFRSLIQAYRHARRSLLRRKNYVRVADLKVSSTDPDAKPMRPTGSASKLGYHGQYVVDGGRARVILATLVTSAAVMENSPMLDLVRWVRFRWHLRPKQATGDTTYATIENIKGLEDDGIRAYLPLPNWSRRPGFYGQEQFTYVPGRDIYLCPQGKELAKRVTKHTEHAHLYQARTEVCNACPVKSSCIESRKGRTIERPFDQAYIERVRLYHETAACRAAISKRKVWVEPLFAEAKTLHGLRRFRLRGIEKVNMEALMTAAGQNLKRLIRHRGTGSPSHSVASLAALSIRLLSSLFRPAITKQAPSFALVP